MDSQTRLELERIKSQERIRKEELKTQLKIAKEETKQAKATAGTDLGAVAGVGIRGAVDAAKDRSSSILSAVESSVSHVADTIQNSKIDVDAAGIKVKTEGKLEPSNAFGSN